jgi:peptide/nickel transport system substrate-binding protein
MLPYLKFKLQRQIRRWRRDIIQSRRGLVDYLDQHIWGRWRGLGAVRRFVMLWWLVFAISLIGSWQQVGALQKAYLVPGPEPGGVYIEGLVGQIKSINPILPEGSASIDVAHLIFNGLTRVNPERQVEGDLAESWDVSADGRSYTFHLRHGVVWQDGQPLLAGDVAYTIGLIQNPDTRSPLASSWQGVKVSTSDDFTVTFTLSGLDQGFVAATTVGILPQHLLQSTDPASLRVADFNQHPIGTGPFKLDSVDGAGTELSLLPNERYYGGRPQLDQFIVKLFDSSAAVQRSYAQHQLTAIGRLQAGDSLTKLGPAHIWSMNMASEVGLFMRTTGVLADKNLRLAIAGTINRQAVAAAAGETDPQIVTEPILLGQLGYSTRAAVPALDPGVANSSLDAAGWPRGADGLRSQDGKPLKLRLATSSAGRYAQATVEIEHELKAVGIGLDIHVVDTTELQQTYIRPRNYDLLLFGISIGADSDVYTYWHSSQVSDPGLNLSQYSSPTADKQLEAGRLAIDTKVRGVRYEQFLATWTADEPAVMLYQPEYLYVTRPQVLGVTARKLINPADRFYDVQNWTVNTRGVQRYN